MIRILVACLKDPGPFELSGGSSDGEAPGLPREADTPELAF